MEDIIRQVYAQWRVAKEQARQECDSRSLPNMAEKYRMCDMFKGTEDLQSLIRLFTSPQGMEFCIKHRFPNIATFRLFKPFNPEKYGVYIVDTVNKKKDFAPVKFNNASRLIKQQNKGFALFSLCVILYFLCN